MSIRSLHIISKGSALDQLLLARRIGKTFSVFIILFILSSFTLSFGAVKTWQPTGGGSWTTGANWNGGTIPVAGDDVIINLTVTGTIINVPTISLNSLSIGGTADLTFTAGGAATLTIGGVPVTDFIISAGSVLILSTNVNLTISGNDRATIDGTFEINSGRTFNTNGFGVITTVNGTINNSGTVSCTNATRLVFNSGSNYNHSRDGGTIPDATWNSNSNCVITGIQNTDLTSGFDQNFGNVIWNCPLQNVEVMLYYVAASGSIAGDFNVYNTGTGWLRISNASNPTLNVGGDFNLYGGTLYETLGTGTPRINIGGNLNVSAGIFNMSSASGSTTIYIDGDLNITGGTFTETGTGNGTIYFQNAGSTQNLRHSAGTLSGTINFVVNTNVTLDFGASDIAEGSGTFTLSDGSTLQTANPSGVNGSIQTTGGQSLSTSANYTFDGAAAQNTGANLPSTVNNFTINNTNGVTLSSHSLTVNGTYNSNGQFSSAFDITFNGPTNCGGTINASAGTVTYNYATPNVITGTYYHLTIGAGVTTATLCGAITVNRNLAVNGTATLYTNTYQITGNAIGTFYHGCRNYIKTR